MMNSNPKWQREFKVAMLEIQNIYRQLQEKWNINAPATDNAAQVRDQNTGGSDVGNNNTKETMLGMQGDKTAY